MLVLALKSSGLSSFKIDFPYYPYFLGLHIIRLALGKRSMYVFAQLFGSFVLGEWTFFLTVEQSFYQLFFLHFQVYGDAFIVDESDSFIAAGRASAGGNYDVVQCQTFAESLIFAFAKNKFPILFKNMGNCSVVFLLNSDVKIDELELQALGQLGTDSAFAAAREAYKNDSLHLLEMFEDFQDEMFGAVRNI